MTGTDLTLRNQAGGLPPAISASLAVLDDDWGVNRALYECQQQGISEHTLAAYAADFAASLAPIQHQRLVDRLTALGMLLAPNRAPMEATIWLRETARLLGDLPEDILNAAIDEAILGKSFLPTIAELRALADPEFKKRQRRAARLNAVSELAATGVTIRRVVQEPPAPVRPLASQAPKAIVRPRKPTRQDYIDMGVDPSVLDNIEQDRAA